MTTASASRRWALVTGASAGIGAAFARELASRGACLVLTARRAERLESLAAEVSARHGIEAVGLVADLADPATPEALCAELAKRGIAIDILVNNAGYGVPGDFHTQPWRTHADFLQVLVTAPCELAYRLLPGMRGRGYGRIANIASLAGHVPAAAGHTLYAAAKAFMIKFSESLAVENAVHGVSVTAVCPGFTYSEFHDVTGSRAVVSRMPAWMWLTAEEVARQGLDALERGVPVYVNGRINRLIKTLTDLLPDRLALALVKRQSRRYRLRDAKGTSE